MASLAEQSIASSYEQLLHVDRDGGGNGATLVDIKDGDNGTTFALKLATDKIQVGDSSTADSTITIESSSGGDPVLNFISTANRSALIRFTEDSAIGGFITYEHSGDNLKFITGSASAGSARLTVNETSSHFTSKLGIGTSSPEERIHSTGAIVSTGVNNTGATAGTERAFIDLVSNKARIGHFRGTTSAGSGGLQFYTDSVERARIDASGNLGIGTSSTVNKLTVNSDTAEDGITITTTNSDSGGSVDEGLGLDWRFTSITSYPWAYVRAIFQGSGDTELAFGTKPASAGDNVAERMRIDNQGRIGIGEDSPDKELHLKGNEPTFRIEQTADANKFFDAQVGTGGGVSKLKFGSETNSNTLVVSNNHRVSIAGASLNEALNVTGNVKVGGNILPATDDSHDLGTASLRFDDIHATNGTIQTSDKRLKNNIADSSLGLDFVNALHPVEYKWKDYSYDIEKEKPIEAKEAVYKTVVIQEAVEAKESVMGTRQKTVSKEVEKTRTEIVEEDGKYVQKEVSYTETVEELQFEEFDLYDEDGEVIGLHKIPVVEEYEVEPAVEAVKEIKEERLVSEAIEAKDAVMETKEKTFARTHFGLIAQEVEQVLKDSSLTNNDFAGLIYDEDADRYGIRYNELISPLIKAVQELSKKVTDLENK